MKKNYEFQNLKKKLKKEKRPPKTYLDYLRESEYLDSTKRYYIKNFDNLNK